MSNYQVEYRRPLLGPKVDFDYDDDDVVIHVYDMHYLNKYVHCCGFGAYHSGVEVYGKEYAYGYTDDDYSGIYYMQPLEADEWAPYRKSVNIGKTSKSKYEINCILRGLNQTNKGRDYSLLTKNCNHFSEELVGELMDDDSIFPRWINRLAWIGTLFECCLPMSLLSLKVEGEEGGLNEESDEDVNNIDEAESSSGGRKYSCEDATIPSRTTFNDTGIQRGIDDLLSKEKLELLTKTEEYKRMQRDDWDYCTFPPLGKSSNHT